jgi:predicted DNA-binding transcriptional regulator AlpA
MKPARAMIAVNFPAFFAETGLTATRLADILGISTTTLWRFTSTGTAPKAMAWAMLGIKTAMQERK